jgi:oxygen-independent coproporphyrinogen-3 oxidase
MTQPYSLYFHIPFCTHRCAYCDFNTYAGQEGSIPAYVDALCREIQFVGSRFPYQQEAVDKGMVHTIFFGGGTPSLLAPKQFESIFAAIRSHFSLMEDAEITIEANPGTVSYESLQELRRVGINRISFGVQSANTEELRMLERTHTFFDVIEAVASARKAGFDNLNLDLIYGLPEQTLQTWQMTVQRILDLHPQHISAYALTLEHGTPFGRWSQKGLLALPDPDLAAEMYEWLSDCLDSNRFIQYEISNWAIDRQRSEVENQTVESPLATFNVQPPTPGYACRHNLQYWRGLPYLAFGAGAHGYANGYRYSNVLRIKSYIERLNADHSVLDPVFPFSPAAVNHHKQSLEEDRSEFLMTGLRLTQEGVSDETFQARFGQSMFDAYPEEINDLLKAGLIENCTGEGNRRSLRLRQRGRLLGNMVFIRFV